MYWCPNHCRFVKCVSFILHAYIHISYNKYEIQKKPKIRIKTSKERERKEKERRMIRFRWLWIQRKRKKKFKSTRNKFFSQFSMKYALNTLSKTWNKVFINTNRVWFYLHIFLCTNFIFFIIFRLDSSFDKIEIVLQMALNCCYNITLFIATYIQLNDKCWLIFLHHN